MFFYLSILFLQYLNVSQKTFPAKTGTVQITINHKVRNEQLELGNKTYQNPSKENYTIDVLKYYIGSIKLNSVATEDEPVSYHLIDASKPDSWVINIILAPGKYTDISFLMGVDSIENVSGAQSGDLDPLKGMFWSWNSGYIMAKMEGHSEASKRNKFEYHIGGYEGENKVNHTIHFEFKTPLIVEPAKISVIPLVADINKWWGDQSLVISKNSSVSLPGVSAKKISDNYSRMFSLP